ncbi:MAG: glycosyltransferase family 2 protein [Fibrobacteria bacterium]|nr:glycosyltransferase family 2 protein [Fibrobacteria bacterium]
MPSFPLVSIIIPVFNGSERIRASFQNLQSMHYTNWEVLYIDNNSTDNSLEEIEYLKQNNPKQIRVFQENKQGVAFARNSGIQYAKGDFLCFLDIDDNFFPDKINILIPPLLKDSTIAMSFGSTYRVYLPGEQSYIQDTGLVYSGENLPPRAGMDWLSNLSHLPQTGATIVRKDIAEKVGGFDEKVGVYDNALWRSFSEDAAFHIKISLNYKVYFINQPVVKYFRHSSSAISCLNHIFPATERYFLTHKIFTLPYTHYYLQKTGNRYPLYWAERAAITNLTASIQAASPIHMLTKYRSLFSSLASLRADFYLSSIYFSLFCLIHSLFPYKLAKQVIRLQNRILYILAPKVFPLEIS